MRTTITIYRHKDRWFTRTSRGDGLDSLRATSYTTNADRDMVKRTIQQLNPDAIIKWEQS